MAVLQKSLWLILVVLAPAWIVSCAQTKNNHQMEYRELTAAEEYVIVHKGTERPFTGTYDDHWNEGTYHCKQCDAALYGSSAKFDAGCGWPAFDDEVPGAVKRLPDPDGRRIEIVCAACDGHLGHVFEGERFTEKNTRHCVNSISMIFKPNKSMEKKTDTAIFAAGCFWGVEHHFLKRDGVISTSVGYIGGHKENPTYEEVCSGNTGHAEALRVVYNPEMISFRDLAILFFEIHDFTQVNRQGPDIGEQYRTEAYYLNESQKTTLQELVNILQDKGYEVATKLTPASRFWDAESYHQQYYKRTGNMPYCHVYRKVFD